MEIGVVVEGEDSRTGRVWPCVSAWLTFVAIDDSRNPTRVPRLIVDSDAVRESQLDGERRRAARLAKR